MPRPSHVRDALRSRLADRGRHGWSIDELHEDLRAAGIAADYSSVFRALNWLEGEGLAQRVELGDGKARYEGASSHHEHVQCERCGTVAVIDACVIEQAAGEIEKLTGYKLRAHSLVLRGVCPSCQA